MKVLVTGGTGVVGRAAVTALVERGHTVRLLSRNARRDAAQWEQGVEAWPGDVARNTGLEGSAATTAAHRHDAREGWLVQRQLETLAPDEPGRASDEQGRHPCLRQ